MNCAYWRGQAVIHPCDTRTFKTSYRVDPDRKKAASHAKYTPMHATPFTTQPNKTMHVNGHTEIIVHVYLVNPVMDINYGKPETL